MKIVITDARRLAVRKFGDETAIVDLRGRTVHRLNATASQLWAMILRGAAQDDLVTSLCDDYEVTREEAGRDVDALLQSLVDAGLILIDGLSCNEVQPGRVVEGASAA